MKAYFDPDALAKLGVDHHSAYVSAQPYPHIAIDNFMPLEYLDEALNTFPRPDEMAFYKYDNALEKKLAFDQVGKLPQPISALLQYMNSPPFLQFLENLTGIEGLIPDPYYRGGGIHQIEKGGKLDVHIDFNKHPKLHLDRRLNAILYLNKNWEESYGGHFEIWKGKQENGKHVLESCSNKILPLFNRFVVFNTSEKSYHGHPEPLTCPEGWSRKSLALYYYTNGRPAEEDVAPHSTTFIKRPQDPEDPEIEEMREKRNLGRFGNQFSKK